MTKKLYNMCGTNITIDLTLFDFFVATRISPSLSTINLLSFICLLRSNLILSKSQVLRIFVVEGAAVFYMIQENLFLQCHFSGNKTSVKCLLSERWAKFTSENFKRTSTDKLSE